MADSPAPAPAPAPPRLHRVHRTTTESLRLGAEPAPPGATGPPGPAAPPAPGNARKISSFQITSVTVGGRTSADGGEDSADDLDETSRCTDAELEGEGEYEPETPSRSEDTFSTNDVFYNACGAAPVIPTSSQYGLAIVPGEPEPDMRAAPAPGPLELAADRHEAPRDPHEHARNDRFKVVKIESTEPFRRGRWTCMDFLDHTTTQQTAPVLVNNVDSGEPQAPDSGVVISEHHEEPPISNELPNKPQVELQATPAALQLEQTIQKSFPMASPGQSLTQPLNMVQQQMPPVQSVSVQSPPLEIPQQMPNQLQAVQVNQQHAQSMTHITLQNPPQNHPPPAQSQPVQQMPQSFPQHQLQQVIAQAQGMPQMQQMPMHQQMQQMPNQAQMQQMPPQHMSQNQMPNMQQMTQQIPQMQPMQNQNQMQVQNPAHMQQMQMQQMQGQTNPQQMHMQQNQIPNMAQQTHHMQTQGQSMGSQQPQLQHMPSQAQIQAMQNQQMPNHMQQIQMTGQVNQMTNTNQQITQMQQMHQMPSQPPTGQQVVPGMHQMQQGMSGVQPQYNQTINQQPNPQSMINSGIPSSQQAMVSQQHNVSQYHTQQPQLSQQGQTLPQEVMSNIASSQQGASMTTNLQALPSQPPGSTLPSNLQSLTSQQQNAMHSMGQQPQSMPQGTLQMMTSTQQSMPMSLDGNQAASMQIPVSDPIYMQSANVGQQLQMNQHMTQPQNMMTQQVPAGQPQHMQQQNQMGGMQYVMPQQQNMQNQNNVSNQQCVVSQSNMQNVNQTQGQSIGQQMPNVSQQGQQAMMQNMVNQVQNIPMSMQQNMPVSMQGTVHSVPTSVVQSQTNVQPSMQVQAGLNMSSYNSQPGVGNMQQNVIPVMSHSNMSQPVMQGQVDGHGQAATQVISGTSSPVISLAVTSAGYVPAQSVTTNTLEGQNFGSPVSAVVSHVVNSLVNSSVGLTSSESGALEVQNDVQPGDIGDGKDESQPTGASEDESINGLAMALGGSASSPAERQEHQHQQSSRPDSPGGGASADRPPHHTSASGTSAVAIDNKIEQAMDLVKSHLMFAVREEVEVLKERIAELMERITQLEVENTYLRAHASQDTLAQLPAPGSKPASLPPAGPPPPVS